MKFIVVSDIHIHPWIAYSKISKEGVPSRLSLYIDLAKQVADTIIKDKCDYCIIPGDFLNAAENRPMVLNTAREFLEIISKTTKIILTPGQHDLDTKSQQISNIHSIASFFSSDRVQYIHEGIVDLSGYKAYIHGWDPEGVLIEDQNNSGTEIYIGHGVVQGSSTPDGFIFSNGIPKDKLFNRYRLSVIGDIHNGTTFTDNTGKYILVPGPPVQNSFRDPEKSGYWIVDYGESINLQFVRVCNPPFHHFISVESGSDAVESEFCHIRVKPSNKSVSITKSIVKEKTNSFSLLSLINTEVQIQKPKDPELVTTCLEELLRDTNVDITKNIPETLIESIDIEGFGNIEKLHLDFSNLPSPLLILGSNGCFSGNTKVKLLNGKNVSFKDLVKNYSESKFYVYSFNILTRKFDPGLAHSPRLTKKDEEVYTITLDNGESIKATKDHLFLLSNNKYTPVLGLKPGDALESIYLTKSGGRFEGYTDFRTTSGHVGSVHRRVADKVLDEPEVTETDLHHKDHNKSNNDPENLVFMTKKDHGSYHLKLGSEIRWKDPEQHIRHSKSTSIRMYNGQAKYMSDKLKESPNYEKKIEAFRVSTIKFNIDSHPCLRKDITLERIINHTKTCTKNYCSTYCISEDIKCSITKIHSVLDKNNIKWEDFVTTYNIKLSPMSIAKNHKVVSVELAGYEDVYDLTVDKYHNFAIDDGKDNGIFVHNSGKSTLLEAIYWVVTGLSTKGLKVGDVVNRFYPKGCKVAINLDINKDKIGIIRTRSHHEDSTSLKVIKNGSIEKSTTRDTQSLITSLIGIDSKIIQVACYLSARNIVIFGDLTPSDKNDLIGMLSDLELVESLRVKLATKIQDINLAKVSSDTQVNSCSIRIGDISFKISNLTTKIQNNKVDDSKIQELSTSLEKYKSELSTIPTDANSLKSVFETKKLTIEKNIEENLDLIGTYKSDIIGLKTNVSKLKENKCFTCSHPLSESEFKLLMDPILLRLTKLDTLIKINEESTKSYKSMLDPVLENLTSQKYFVDKHTELTKLISETQSILLEEKAKSTTSADEAILSSLKEDLEVEKKKLVEFTVTKDKNSLLQETLTLISKSISRSGSVVKRLISQSCDELSNELSLLLSGSNISAKMDSKDIELVCSIDGSERLYKELSSGEKQIVDLALLIGFNNILSRKYNQSKGILGMIALDEVFSYLDPSNSELAQQLISKSIAKTLMIVTHDTSLQSQFSNVLSVTKVNNYANYKLLV